MQRNLDMIQNMYSAFSRGDVPSCWPAPFAHVWKLHGEAVVGFEQFMDTAMVQQAMR